MKKIDEEQTFITLTHSTNVERQRSLVSAAISMTVQCDMLTVKIFYVQEKYFYYTEF
jgi:hypothetical protein